MYATHHDRYRRGGSKGAEAPPAERGQEPRAGGLRAPGGESSGGPGSAGQLPVDGQADGGSGRPRGQGGGASGPRGPVSCTVDVNLLLYASDASSRFHEPARDLLDRLSRGPEIVYLFWPVIMGYLRT